MKMSLTQAMRSLAIALLPGILALSTACGGGGSSPTSGTHLLSGNWQITLTRHVNPLPPLVFTGFLIQSGDSVSGSLKLGTQFLAANCQGVGTISGNIKDQNVSFTIGELGQQISLTGAMAADNSMSGQFSNLAGACTNFANTGSWTAVPIAPINGNFHATFTSSEQQSNGTIQVKGAIAQGANTGNSTASLAGTMVETGSPHFCFSLDNVTFTGLVSGTDVTISLYALNGIQVAQIPNAGDINQPTASVTTDGKVITGSYIFPASSSSPPCNQPERGTFTMTID